MDELIINAKMDTKGFEAGTKRLAGAIKSFGSSVDRSMKSIQGAGRSVLSTIMKWGPALLGVGGAYSIISKSVSAFMSQNQQLQGTLTSCWTAIGNMLGPIITQIVNMIATVVSYLVTFLNLLGLTSKTASQAGKAAGGAAQQLKKQLMGFDELNVMQDNQGGGGGAGGLQDVDPSEWMQKLAELLKNKMWDAAADMVISKLNELIYAFRDKAEEWGKIAGEWIQGITHFIARILDETDWKQLGVGLANLLNGLLAEVEGINFGEDLGKIIAAKFTIAFKIITGFLEQFNFARLGNIVSDGVRSIFDSMSRAIDQANPELIGQNIAKFFNAIEWTKIADSIANFLNNAWDFAVTALHNFITSVNWQNIGEGIREFFQKIDWAKIKDDLKTLLGDAWNAAIDFLCGLLGIDTSAGSNRVVEIGNAIRNMFKNIPWEEITEEIKELFENMWNTVLDFFWGLLSDDTTNEPPVISVFRNLIDILDELSWDISDFIRNIGQSITAFVELINGKITFKEFLDKLKNLEAGTHAASRAYENTIQRLEEFEAVLGRTPATTGDAITYYNSITDAINDIDVSLRNSNLSETQRNELYEHRQTLLARQQELYDQYVSKTDQAAEAVTRENEALQSALNHMSNLSVAMRRGHGDLEELSSAFYQYKDAVDSTNMTQEQAQNACRQLEGVLGSLRKQYGDSATDMELYKQVQELMTQVSEEYNVALSDQAHILMNTEQTIRGSATATAEGAQAATDAANANALAKESQEQLATAMQNTQRESQQLVSDTENVKGEIQSLGDVGKPSAQKLGTEYTTEMSSQSTSMEASTKEAGAKASEAFKTGIEEGSSATQDAARQMVQDTASVIQTEIESRTQHINSVVQNSVSLITNTIQNCQTMVSAAVTGSRNLITQSFNAMQTTVTSSMNAINSIVMQVFNNLIQLSGQAGIAIAQNFAAGMTSLYDAAANVAIGVNDMLSSYFGQIAQNGYVWGNDLGLLFNNGLVDACNAYLIPTLNQVAQSIKNVIGFSKPKEGPLSDADTYMPDFMQLLTKGVEENMDKPLSAVAGLADGVKDELQNGDYTFGDFEAGELDTAFSTFGNQFLDGFGALVNRLDAIAERVTYALPDVAAGGVLPYSVSTEMPQNSSGSSVSMNDVLSAIVGLRDFLSANNTENQGISVNVFLDGEQIESAVSLRQRRKNVARGA